MQNGYDLNLYSRRILLLPTMYNCGWAGLGSVGCGGSCYVFMNVRMGVTRSRRHAWVYHSAGAVHGYTTQQAPCMGWAVWGSSSVPEMSRASAL